MEFKITSINSLCLFAFVCLLFLRQNIWPLFRKGVMPANSLITRAESLTRWSQFRLKVSAKANVKRKTWDQNKLERHLPQGSYLFSLQNQFCSSIPLSRFLGESKGGEDVLKESIAQKERGGEHFTRLNEMVPWKFNHLKKIFDIDNFICFNL